MSQETNTTLVGNPSKARSFKDLTTRLLSHVELTFFNVHLAAFVLVPLAASGIFYGSNGRFHIDYLDSLFLCYSAMTVTGLSTINLSTLTGWQQAMLYILMCMGHIATVSWIMVLVRKHYFRTHVENLPERRKIFPTREAFMASISSPIAAFKPRDVIPVSGKYAGNSNSTPNIGIMHPTPATTFDPNSTYVGKMNNQHEEDHLMSDINTFTSSPRAATIQLSPVQSRTSQYEYHPRGVEFDLTHSMTPAMRQRQKTRANTMRMPGRSATILSAQSTESGKIPRDGLPNPINMAKHLMKRAAPKTYRHLERKLTLPYNTTLEENKTSWLSGFNLAVGRNSYFFTETLTDEQLEIIGGAEYRALRVLSYLVPMYFILTQLFSFILFAPWLATTSEYDAVFEAQPRLVNKTWFAVFQTMGAYTGGGLTLVDKGMVPFQGAYLMIFALMFVILAGNHALPIFLRFIIWIGSKVAQSGSDLDQAFEFLLHHPRRCFIYLFPSHQTWFLLICLVALSAIEWVMFEVLNIGLDPYKALNPGVRIVVGLFQGLAARASGYAIFPLADAAPALQFLYVVMMYIAVYPVAMSIRSTNVNEEPSLGVFEAAPEEDEEEPPLDELEKYEPRQRVGKYLGWHLRKQISIDIWWFVWAVWAVAIIERGSLMDQDRKWFDLFRVLFELVSAFGGIGLSLGYPDDNVSFVGAFKPLSKIVVIIIMVRGRHRGLPVSIDRAVTLPFELATRQRNADQEKEKAAEVAAANERYRNGNNDDLPLSLGPMGDEHLP